MFRFLTRHRLAGSSLVLAGVVATGGIAAADSDRFSDFTPLASSAGSTADEAAPITFGNSSFQQRSAADRTAQLAAGEPNSGSWDMITLNETGAQKGRYLFTPFETGQSGIQRLSVDTGEAETLFTSPAVGEHNLVRRLLLDAVGHLHHGRGVVVLGSRRLHHEHPWTSLRAHEPDHGRLRDGTER